MMKQKSKNTAIQILLRSAFITALTISAFANAKPDRPKGPPPEAKEACVNKTEGDSVSFSTPRGDTIEASCQMLEDELVAVPLDHEQRKERKH